MNFSSTSGICTFQIRCRHVHLNRRPGAYRIHTILRSTYSRRGRKRKEDRTSSPFLFPFSPSPLPLPLPLPHFTISHPFSFSRHTKHTHSHSHPAVQIPPLLRVRRHPPPSPHNSDLGNSDELWRKRAAHQDVGGGVDECRDLGGDLPQDQGVEVDGDTGARGGCGRSG